MYIYAFRVLFFFLESRLLSIYQQATAFDLCCKNSSYKEVSMKGTMSNNREHARAEVERIMFIQQRDTGRLNY